MMHETNVTICMICIKTSFISQADVVERLKNLIVSLSALNKSAA